jgi:molecular chaperone GrpE
MSLRDEHLPEEEGAAGPELLRQPGREYAGRDAGRDAGHGQESGPGASAASGGPGAHGGPGDRGVPGGTQPAPDVEHGAADEYGAGNGEHGHENGLSDPGDPLEVVARERDEYLRALQRTQADFENYRKQIARRQEEQVARAAVGLVEKVLPVLDTLDLAEAHLNESLDVSADAKALRASRAMLMDILAREGLERIDQAGVPFDPSMHDAVAHSEGDGNENGQTIVEEVLRSGYRWKGQMLRAAMVRVRG